MRRRSWPTYTYSVSALEASRLLLLALLRPAVERELGAAARVLTALSVVSAAACTSLGMGSAGARGALTARVVETGVLLVAGRAVAGRAPGRLDAERVPRVRLAT